MYCLKRTPDPTDLLPRLRFHPKTLDGKGSRHNPFWMNRLRELGGSVALVGLDDDGTSDLLVGVGGPDDEPLLLVNDGEGGEALVLAELVAPAGGDGVGAAGGRAAGSLGGGLGTLLDLELARSDGAGANVNAELPGAEAVVGVAPALSLADGPLGRGGHHGDGVSGSGGGTRDGEGGSSEDGGELHVEVCLVCVGRGGDGCY